MRAWISSAMRYSIAISSAAKAPSRPILTLRTEPAARAGREVSNAPPSTPRLVSSARIVRSTRIGASKSAGTISASKMAAEIATVRPVRLMPRPKRKGPERRHAPPGPREGDALALSGCGRHRSPRQHADEMGSIIGAGVDIAVEARRRNAHTLQSIGGEVLQKRLLESGCPESARSGPGDANSHAALRRPRHEDANHGVTRGGVRELLIGGALRDGEGHRGYQLPRLERRFEQPFEE